MSAGLKPDAPEPFSEVESEPPFVHAILRQPRVFEPGSKIVYSTLSTYLLGAVVAHSVGSSLCDYTQDRVFGPLGVTVDHWHTDREGYFNAGSSAFLTPREMARIGQLVLQRGSWEGRQILPAEWIDQMLTERWDLGCRPPPDRQGYGYLWWHYDVAGFDNWRPRGSVVSPSSSSPISNSSWLRPMRRCTRSDRGSRPVLGSCAA